jgi:hypothetical protein
MGLPSLKIHRTGHDQVRSHENTIGTVCWFYGSLKGQVVVLDGALWCGSLKAC